MARIYNSWLYENNPCQRTQPGLTKGDQKVDQSLKQWPSCGTCVGGGHSLVWPKDTKKFETVSCLRNPCQHRARRPGDKLSCRKPAGPATKQSLSGGYFLNPAILPTHGSSHYGGASKPGYLRKRIKGRWMDWVRHSNAESGLLKGKPGVDVGSRKII